MRRTTAICAGLAVFAVTAAAAGTPSRTVITVLGFSDYHSHAVPFYSEGRQGQGGIARAIGLFRAAKAEGPTLVLSGGDMLNAGTPTWSDEYGCVEWRWLRGLVAAMALGNHDLDYGAEAFARCRASAGFPLLSANLLGADGRPLLTAADGKPYLVTEVGGVRIGVFAVAGSDVGRLVKAANLPPGAHFTDAFEAARAMVAALREREHAAAVIAIGHQYREDDERMAREVPGIDLILGSHSHAKGDLARIEGSRTWFLSAYQYLAYVARVRLTFEAGRFTGATGGLVALDASIPEDPEVAQRVADLQRKLREKHRERFRDVGATRGGLSDDGVTNTESEIGNWATDVLRRAAGAHVFVNTASSFRGGLPDGRVLVEDLRGAIPYANHVVTARMTGVQVEALCALLLSRRWSDSFSQQSGLRITAGEGGPASIEIVADPSAAEPRFVPLDPQATYRVATTDFQAFVVDGYKELFAAGAEVATTDLDIHTLLERALGDTPSPRLDGRTRFP